MYEQGHPDKTAKTVRTARTASSVRTARTASTARTHRTARSAPQDRPARMERPARAASTTRAALPAHLEHLELEERPEPAARPESTVFLETRERPVGQVKTADPDANFVVKENKIKSVKQKNEKRSLYTRRFLAWANPRLLSLILLCTEIDLNTLLICFLL